MSINSVKIFTSK